MASVFRIVSGELSVSNLMSKSYEFSNYTFYCEDSSVSVNFVSSFNPRKSTFNGV